MTSATIVRINQTLEELTNELTCPAHHKRPKLSLQGYDFQIDCCCFMFKAECTRQVAIRIMLTQAQEVM